MFLSGCGVLCLSCTVTEMDIFSSILLLSRHASFDTYVFSIPGHYLQPALKRLVVVNGCHLFAVFPKGKIANP